jgi:hypothetical protein
MKYRYLIVLIAMAVASVGQVAAQEESDANTSFDGLVEIKKGVFKRSWVDPDVDFTQYTKVLSGGAHFEFRAVKKGSSTSIQRMNKREFYISDADQQKLIDTVSRIFEEELAKSKHFTIVEAPGPDVMVLRGGLLDIVSHVPPDMVGRGTIYLSSVGEATLVLELLDSLSGETIYRAVERRAAGQSNNDMMGSSPVRSWSEVKRWARRWGSRLRVGLDSIHK